MTGNIANNTMPLAVIPKNELAYMATKEAAKANRLERMAHRFGVTCLVCSAAIIGGAAALGLAPIAAPIVLGAGLVSMAGSIATALSLQFAADRAGARHDEAVKKRADRLAAAARFALEQAVADGAIRVGLDLPVRSEDETPKKVYVEDIRAIIDTFGRKKLGLTAQVLEGDGRSIEWMDRRNRSKLCLELSVATLPREILDSVRNEIAPAESPVPIREPEKILPPINFPLLPG